MLVVTALAVVFVGTLYPLALDALTRAERSTVGPPFFAVFFGPISCRADGAGAVRAAAALAQGRPEDRGADAWPRRWAWPRWRRLPPLRVASPRSATGVGAFALAGWLLGATVIEIRKRKGARACAFAAAIAHAGLAVSLIGVTGTLVWRSEDSGGGRPRRYADGRSLHAALCRRHPCRWPQYRGNRARVELMDGDNVKADDESRAAHLYRRRPGYQCTPAIRTTGLRDLYLALGDDRGNGRWVLRAIVSPLAPFIWLGGLVMCHRRSAQPGARLRDRQPETKPAAPRSRPSGRMRRLFFCAVMSCASPRHALVMPSGAATGRRNLRRSGHGSARAHHLQRQLRCMVCQGQSIDESDAPWRRMAQAGARTDRGGQNRWRDPASISMSALGTSC